MCKYVHKNLVQEWKLIMETNSNSSLKLWWMWIEEFSSGHRNEHSSLTVIMSSRAFSTFSLAWFIMLDLWLWRVLIIPINSFYQRYSSSKIPAWTKYDFILNFLRVVIFSSSELLAQNWLNLFMLLPRWLVQWMPNKLSEDQSLPQKDSVDSWDVRLQSVRSVSVWSVG